jgi:hypothetical protein
VLILGKPKSAEQKETISKQLQFRLHLHLPRRGLSVSVIDAIADAAVCCHKEAAKARPLAKIVKVVRMILAR